MSIRGYIPARVGAQLSSMRIAFKSVVITAAVAMTVVLGLGSASAATPHLNPSEVALVFPVTGDLRPDGTSTYPTDVVLQLINNSYQQDVGGAWSKCTVDADGNCTMIAFILDLQALGYGSWSVRLVSGGSQNLTMGPGSPGSIYSWDVAGGQTLTADRRTSLVRPNPGLPACGDDGLKIALVADLTVNIAGVKQAAKDYMGALLGSRTDIALFTFGRDSDASADKSYPLTSVQTSDGAAHLNSWINSWNASGQGGMDSGHWDRGLGAVLSSGETFDMVILIGNSYPHFPQDAATTAANGLKAQGTRVIVTSVDTEPKVAYYASTVSGPVYDDPVLAKNDTFPDNTKLKTLLGQLGSTCPVVHGLAVTVQYVDDQGVIIAAPGATTLFGNAGDPVGFTYDMAVAGAPEGYLVLSIDNIDAFYDRGVPQVITVHVIKAPVLPVLTFHGSLSFSDGFRISPNVCGGTAISPDHVTATLLLTDQFGNPAAGMPVDWSADQPFLIGTADAVTGTDGKAYAEVSLAPGTTGVGIRMEFWPQDGTWHQVDTPAVLAGFAGTSVSATPEVANLPLPRLRVPVGSMSVIPTNAFPVHADGVSSWTMMVHVEDQCGPVVGATVSFFAGGSAVVSDAQAVTDANGWARVTVTDVVAEQVPVWVQGSFLIAVPDSPVTVDFTAAPVTNNVVALDGGLSFSFASANEGQCQGDDRTETQLWAAPLDSSGKNVRTVGGGIVFSLPAGSPLQFVSSPVVADPVEYAPGSWGYVVRVRSAVSGQFEVYARTADGLLEKTIWVGIADGLIDPAASSVSIDSGPRLSDGSDAFTVTANLVSMCGLPVTSLGTQMWSGPNWYWLDLVAVDTVTGQPAGTAVRVSDWKADPTRPGVYTATVKSLVPGMYALTANAARLGGYPVPGDQSRTPVNPSPLMAQFVAPVTPDPQVVPPSGAAASVGGRWWPALVGLMAVWSVVMRRM